MFFLSKLKKSIVIKIVTLNRVDLKLKIGPVVKSLIFNHFHILTTFRLENLLQ